MPLTDVRPQLTHRWSACFLELLAALIGMARSQEVQELLSAREQTYAQRVDCSIGLVEQGYIYCADYPYDMEVMRIEVPQNLVLAGFQLRFTRYEFYA